VSLVADALQPFLVRGLTSLSGRAQGLGIPDIITDETKKGYDVDFDDVGGFISIDFREINSIVPAIALDCCRFSSASFQSILKVPDDILDKTTTPWSFVRLYYAAFYAGHALIRMFGESCSYLDRRHVRRLSEMGELLGRPPSFTIESGLYHCVVSVAATGLKMKRARGSVGGAHESFWDVFGTLMDRVADETLRGPLAAADAKAVFLKLGACRNTLRSNGCRAHNWLSDVRNNLQYRHGYGVWLPLQITKRVKESLSRSADQWNKDPMDIDIPTTQRADLPEFVAACIFIVALCRVMLVRIADRSSAGGRCFLRLGPMALFRDGEFRWK
jgi:hypothetical protein